MKRVSHISLSCILLILHSQCAKAEHLFGYCSALVNNRNKSTTYYYSKLFPYDGDFNSHYADEARFQNMFNHYVGAHYESAANPLTTCILMFKTSSDTQEHLNSDAADKRSRKDNKVVFTDWSPE